MDIVMNNNDLRGVIFSYFRTKAYRECDKCNKVLCWNKGEIANEHVHWGNFSRCYECFRNNFFMKSEHI